MKQVWETKKLGEVCDLISRGISPKYTEEGGVVVLNQKCIRNHEINFEFSRLHDLKTKKVNDEKFIKKGDVLINSTGTGTLGRLAQIRSKLKNVIVDSHITIARPKEELFYQDFFGWSMINIENKIAESGEGTSGQTELSRSKLKEEFFISYPNSLPEQQRIVAILDECFAEIDQAKANAEQNLKNAKELFESYLQGVFENGDWEKKEFGNVITILTDYHANGSYQILKKNVELKDTEDFAWMVRSTDFENNFENEFRFIDEAGYNFLSKSKVFGGDIIMSKIGNAGNVYFMPRIDRPCSLAMNLFLIRLNERKAEPKFIFQYLKSYSGEFQIKSRLQGATTKTITKNNVRNILIPLPTLNEQQAIVQQLEALRAETQKLEAIYQKKLDDLEELKKSILQKAFAGELPLRKAGLKTEKGVKL